MKVEVGDWVKVRGLKRVYEVCKVVEFSKADGGDLLKLTGVKSAVMARSVTEHAAKFWIKKAGANDSAR